MAFWDPELLVILKTNQKNIIIIHATTIGDDIRTIERNADVLLKCLYGYWFSSKHREN